MIDPYRPPLMAPIEPTPAQLRQQTEADRIISKAFAGGLSRPWPTISTRSQPPPGLVERDEQAGAVGSTTAPANDLTN